MEFWYSAELDIDVNDLYTKARKVVCKNISENLLSGRDYGKVKAWNVIAIIMKDSSTYPEIAKYYKKKCEFEFRLKINHDQFLIADVNGAVAMMYTMLHHSIRLMNDLAGGDIFSEKLESNFIDIIGNY